MNGTPGNDGRPSRGGDSRLPDAVDYYELLEVSPRASQPVIQAAYRVLARQSHPDAYPGETSASAERRIRQLNAAYQVLSDGELRARYDLERIRARRFERLVSPERITPSEMPQAPRARTLATRALAPTTDDHFPAMRGGAVLVLIVVAALTTLSLVLVAASIDPAHDPAQNDIPGYTRVLGDLSGR
ncbi:MAG TPA: J domain-containing protein [Chloroflexota bacterium]